jgi:type II secretory pathway pseudopilin PulG
VEIALFVITVLSIATAAVAFTSARRVQRTEQQRSEARVAALAAAADQAHSSEAHPSAQTNVGRWNQMDGGWHWSSPNDLPRDEAGRELFTPPIANEVRPSAAVLGISANSGETSTTLSANLFGAVQRKGRTAGSFAIMAAAAVILALGGALVVFTTSGHGKTAAPVAQAARSEPLELVSLGHSREASLLTITGIVRNPATGQKIEGLTAVVSLIDGHGGLISTKDVPLDYRALGPGEEAPFKVTVPDPGSVAKYRVSFRAGTEVVPHVDKRSDSKMASAL